ncbi:MAG: glycine zipper family protein [Methylococcaceae bacterium]|nr:glycine zipper family protein [Methylococcaceae bacterium]
MSKKIPVVFPILAAAAIAGGCATYGGWEPVVDPYTDSNPAMIQQDTAQCRMLAQQAAGTATEALKGAAAGALIGAAGGAAMGAIVGDPGAGAAIGATAGGIGGATQQGVDADYQYKRAFINCMRGRGHNVIN